MLSSLFPEFRSMKRLLYCQLTMEKPSRLQLFSETVGQDDIRISSQAWGARLDKENSDRLLNLRKTVVVVEMPSPELENSLKAQGHTVILIDHHDYEALQRSNAKSSIEQISDLLHQPLSRFQRGVAINDRAYIYGLLEADYSSEEVVRIREYDLASQGLTTQELALNRRACAGRVNVGELTVVVAETTKVSLIGDLHTLAAPTEVRDLLVLLMQVEHSFSRGLNC